LKTKAIYSGSFDPIHNGHLDIINRASLLFDLEVVVANNPAKSYLMNLDSRVHCVKGVLMEAKLEIPVHCLESGLLIKFAKDRGITTIVKGIRGFADYDYERLLHEVAVSQQPEMETVLLPGSASLQHISSSVIKDLVKLNGNLTGYASPGVIVWVRHHLRQNSTS